MAPPNAMMTKVTKPMTIFLWRKMVSHRIRMGYSSCLFFFFSLFIVKKLFRLTLFLFRGALISRYRLILNDIAILSFLAYR